MQGESHLYSSAMENRGAPFGGLARRGRSLSPRDGLACSLADIKKLLVDTLEPSEDAPTTDSSLAVNELRFALDWQMLCLK